MLIINSCLSPRKNKMDGMAGKEKPHLHFKQKFGAKNSVKNQL
jgi:hypothetical protein